MSWQAYVDTQLAAHPDIEQACILGHDGALWASTPDFFVSD